MQRPVRNNPFPRASHSRRAKAFVPPGRGTKAFARIILLISHIPGKDNRNFPPDPARHKELPFRGAAVVGLF